MPAKAADLKDVIWQTDTCFAGCEGLNSPVGRLSSLWVTVKLFQVLHRQLFGSGQVAPGLFNLAEKQVQAGRIQTAATGPLILYKTSAMT